MGDKGEPKSCVWLWTLPSPAQASKGGASGSVGSSSGSCWGWGGVLRGSTRPQQTQDQAEGSWPVV